MYVCLAPERRRSPSSGSVGGRRTTHTENLLGWCVLAWDEVATCGMRSNFQGAHDQCLLCAGCAYHPQDSPHQPCQLTPVLFLADFTFWVRKLHLQQIFIWPHAVTSHAGGDSREKPSCRRTAHRSRARLGAGHDLPPKLKIRDGVDLYCRPSGFSGNF
ncbi:uncharacterized protein LY79DRAFT_130583 [Colletotrichum navitas]|uniref:Uncharacterized protein n=1 Tax=Colletotrichum navitas TaxID=681940 RepID=A0AAD8Q2U3_9PEZI|nr:uncharacterized protein LY79DRAFT_130583 [Colletotrichum navitas]KAK1594504.1 hypothetical protein LY79DRAFT_130583 [Colletotrichum navitas]